MPHLISGIERFQLQYNAVQTFFPSVIEHLVMNPVNRMVIILPVIGSFEVYIPVGATIPWKVFNKQILDFRIQGRALDRVGDCNRVMIRV